MANTRWDWHLSRGIASVLNFWVLIGLLCSFPFVLSWTRALEIPEVPTPQHTSAYVKACFVLIAFLWICFTVVWAGIRRGGRITWRDLIGARWNSWQDFIRDLGIAGATFLGMGVIGGLSNVLLRSWQHDTPAFRAIVSPQNRLEAWAFLAAAVTAGFVEEFVFRGYIQKQCQALFGNTILPSALQVIAFTSGHLYQGWVRLVPVLLIGILLTIVALWRRSLVPGMIAHALGDGLVAFSYFAHHW